MQSLCISCIRQAKIHGLKQLVIIYSAKDFNHFSNFPSHFFFELRLVKITNKNKCNLKQEKVYYLQ